VRIAPLVILATVTAVTSFTSSCSAGIDVALPTDVEPASAKVCADLADSLPDTVTDQEGRATEPTSPLTAAWGEPAIVLRCGVPRPGALTRTSQLVTVNGVDWFAEELTEGYVFTTYGRQVYVEVTVPDDYAPEVRPVTELSSAVADAVPERVDAPAGSP
jgi:hypothetical protein